MRLRFNLKLYSSAALAVAALIYGVSVEPLASANENDVAASEGEAPLPAADESASASTESTEEKLDDLDVIDLNEPLDEQVEKWDSAQTRYPTQSTPVTIENIVEPSGEYRYASFGKPNPFLPPLKIQNEADGVAGVEGDMSPASDLAMASITSGVNTSAAAPSENGGGGAGRMHEIPVVSTLQKFPLARLELKGVWQLESGEKRAIVMTPNKEGIIVKVSDPISAGKILEINRDHLVVRQYRLREDGVREFADENLYLGSAARREKTFVRLLPGQPPEFEPTVEKPATGTVQEAPSNAVAAPKNKMPVDPAAAGAVPPVVPNAPRPVPNGAPAGVAAPAAVAPNAVAPAVLDGPLSDSVPAPFGAPVPATPASTTGSSQP